MVDIKHKTEEVAFLKSVIDKLILCVTTNGGTAFMTRSEFDKSLSSTGAPTDYSYDQFVDDSIGDKFRGIRP